MFDVLDQYLRLIKEDIDCYLICVRNHEGNFLTCLVTNDGGFSKTELILLGVGFVGWAIAYRDVLKNIHQFKIVEIPLIVAAMDLSYELIWGFLNIQNSLGILFNIGNIAWFIKDLHINYHAVKYGHKLISNQWIKRHYLLIYWFILINSFFITYYMSNGSTQVDNGLGLVAAYFINLMISGLYIYQLLSYPEYRNQGFSYRVAWAKFLGTGAISIVCFMSFPVPFLHWMCLSIFVMDITYIYLFKYYQPSPVHTQPSVVS